MTAKAVRQDNKRLVSALACALALAACAAPRATTDLPDDPEQALGELAWMAGDWRRLNAQSASGERWWMDGDELRGETWIQDGPRRLLLERLAIRIEDDRVVYAPEPLNSKPPYATFPLAELGRRAVAFENREHGHPWRIQYTTTATGMEARVFFKDPGPGGSTTPRIQVLQFVKAASR